MEFTKSSEIDLIAKYRLKPTQSEKTNYGREYYEAICYGWRHIETGEMYIGYHKTREIYDNYVFSTDNLEANLAWSYGKLKRSILYRGDQSIAITLENFLLKSVNANKNPKFYNQSVGGGEGCVKDFSNLTEEIKQIGLDWIDGIDPVVETISSAANNKEIEQIARNIKDGKYKIHNEKTVEVDSISRYQVRLFAIDPDLKEKIKVKMQNPEKARNWIMPVIVLVHDDGKKEIIDGNHTVAAAKEVGWIEIPVIYIHFSEFYYKRVNVHVFGNEMNHEERIKKPNDKEDLKMAIMRFTETYKDHEIGTEEFKEAFISTFNKYWSNSQIAKTIESVKDHLETIEAMKTLNFKVYEKSELKAITDRLADENPGHAVISITSGSCYNAGIGAVANKAGELDTWDSIMVVSHRTLNEYNLWTKKGGSKDKLNAAMKRMHPNLKCKVEVLPAFVNVTK